MARGSHEDVDLVTPYSRSPIFGALWLHIWQRHFSSWQAIMDPYLWFFTIIKWTRVLSYWTGYHAVLFIFFLCYVLLAYVCSSVIMYMNDLKSFVWKRIWLSNAQVGKSYNLHSFRAQWWHCCGILLFSVEFNIDFLLKITKSTLNCIYLLNSIQILFYWPSLFFTIAEHLLSL